jgi:hypothetical protein
MTGSLVNRLKETSNKPDPKVGDGATILMWSDREPATVVEVIRFTTGARKGEVKAVVIQEDNYKVIMGSMHDGSARYNYSRNEDAPRVTYTKDRAGRFKNKGGRVLSIGKRDKWYDPSF